MLRVGLLIGLAAAAATGGLRYTSQTLEPVLLGLPSLHEPRSSLAGLSSHLQRAEVLERRFVARVQQYGTTISKVVLPMAVSGPHKCYLQQNGFATNSKHLLGIENERIDSIMCTF